MNISNNNLIKDIEMDVINIHKEYVINYDYIRLDKYLENYNENNIIYRHTSISFSGGGYNCIYHIGIAKYIFDNPELFKNMKYLGASGGAGIIGILLCYENDNNKFKILDEIIEKLIDFNKKKYKLSDQVNMYIELITEYITEDKFNIYIKDTDRCHISITDISKIYPRNFIKKTFIDYDDFIKTLQATSCVPFFLDNTVRFIDSIKCIDGGLTNNIPIIDKNTIKISCLNYPFMNADIYPKIISSLKHTILLPDKNYIMNMYNLGYSDIENYMIETKKKLLDIKLNNEINDMVSSFFDE
jgi:hypothetical protein